MLLDTLHDVVTVPIAAVQRGAPGTYVYLVNPDDTVAVHPIRLGAEDGGFYEVASGLAPGDRVVTDGADRLRDGAHVRIPGKAPASPGSAAPPGNAGTSREHREHRRRGPRPQQSPTDSPP